MDNGGKDLILRGDETSQLCMMLIVVELLQPFYVRFRQDRGEKYDNCSITVLDEVWQFVMGEAREIKSKALAQRYYDMAPDTEDVHDSEFTSRALDFCNGMGMLLDFVCNPIASNVIEVLGYIEAIGGEIDAIVDSPDKRQGDFYSNIFLALSLAIGTIRITSAPEGQNILGSLRHQFRSSHWKRRALLLK